MICTTERKPLADMPKILPDEHFITGEIGRIAYESVGLIAVELIARKTVIVDESLFEDLLLLKGQEASILRQDGEWSCAPMKKGSQ